MYGRVGSSHPTSVTRLLDYLSNTWPITAMKILPNNILFAKVGPNFWKHKITPQKLPNMVTLPATFRKL